MVFVHYNLLISLDVDECKHGDNKCDLKAAHCVNKPGSYSCQCKEGYQQMDNYTCRLPSRHVMY